MAKAESIDALLSPSLRVSRPVAACARCRSAKIKCDGKLPACSACERSGKASSCSSANDDFARGKERSYVAALEAASERLQRRIDETRSSRVSEETSADTIDSPTSTTVAGKPATLSRTMSNTQRMEAAVVDELVGDLGFLSVNATARDFHGFTSTMSFARLLISASIAVPLPHFGSSPLPPRYAATPLIQHYLDNIFVLLPFFSETDLMSSVSNVYHEGGKPAKPIEHWHVRMILAIAAGASSQSRGDANHEMALRHVAAALEFAEEVLHPGSIAGVQAILLLVQYALVDPEHFRSWYLIGMASRLMVDLGIHVEPSTDIIIPKHILEIRRKVFYCVYALDRAISMSLERSFGFTDDSAPGIQLPVLAANQNKQQTRNLFLRSLQPSLYLFDIRRVQSAFYQTTRSSSRNEMSMAMASDYTTSILADIQSWHATIPASLAQRHVLYFRLESLYSQILAISPSSRIPFAKVSDLSRTMLFELALQFIDQMQPVIQDSNWHAFLNYTDICRVKFVGRQFLDVLWSNFDQMLAGGVAHSPQMLSKGHSLTSTTLLSSSPLDNCARTIDCIRKIAEILDYARQRWNQSLLRDRFEQESAVMLGKLKSRQQELSSVHQLSGRPSHTEPYTEPSVRFPSNKSQNASVQPTYSMGGPPLLNSQSTFQTSFDGQGQSPPLFRTSSQGHSVPSGLTLPQGSLPRRSYEFFSKQGE